MGTLFVFVWILWHLIEPLWFLCNSDLFNNQMLHSSSCGQCILMRRTSFWKLLTLKCIGDINASWSCCDYEVTHLRRCNNFKESESRIWATFGCAGEIALELWQPSKFDMSLFGSRRRHTDVPMSLLLCHCAPSHPRLRALIFDDCECFRQMWISFDENQRAARVELARHRTRAVRCASNK